MKLEFEDPARTITHQGKQSPRKIPVMVWYPTQQNSGEKKPFLDLDFFTQFRKAGFLNRIALTKAQSIPLNSFVDAPVHPGTSVYPLILFHHGYGEILESNSLQAELLASNGYIVASIGHPLHGCYLFEDGTFSKVEIPPQAKIEKRENKAFLKTFNSTLKSMDKGDLSLDQLRVLSETLVKRPKAYNADVYTWVADNAFILDEFGKLNSDSGSPFYRRIDFAKGVGLFGHSFGGPTSLISCATDSRCRCGVNMDGAMFGCSNPELTFDFPTMYFKNETTKNMCRYFHEVNTADSYRLSIKGATHMDFTNLHLIVRYKLVKMLKMAGSIAPEKIYEIMDLYLLRFFDKYLKGSPALSIPENKFEEIDYDFRTHQP